MKWSLESKGITSKGLRGLRRRCGSRVGSNPPYDLMYACALSHLGQANSRRQALAFGILAVREKMVTDRKKSRTLAIQLVNGHRHLRRKGASSGQTDVEVRAD